METFRGQRETRIISMPIQESIVAGRDAPIKFSVEVRQKTPYETRIFVCEKFQDSAQAATVRKSAEEDGNVLGRIVYKFVVEEPMAQVLANLDNIVYKSYFGTIANPANLLRGKKS